jgi:hypothetical protein
LALEDLDTEVKINIAWETIRKAFKISAKESLGYYELKKDKPMLNERQQTKTKQTPWSESESELYRPSDRRLSAKLVTTFANRWCNAQTY